MKLKLKSKTIENITVELPEKPSETAEKILAQAKAQAAIKTILADGAEIDGPSIEGDEVLQDPEPVVDDGPHTHPDIIINQELEVEAETLEEAQEQAFQQAQELISNFANPQEYEPLVISDDDGSNERTFTQVEFSSYQYTQPKFVWNEDGKGGLAAPSSKYFVDIYLRGIEQED